MGAVIITAGMLTNQKPRLSANPHECHEFLYNVEYSDGDMNEHIEWYAEGAFPNGLTIDPISGVISGNIKPLHKQDDCQDNLNPDEPLAIDGSNHEMNGLYKDATHTFTFDICRRYNMLDLLVPDNPPYEEVVKSTVTLMVIKSANIFNTVFMEKFVKAEDVETNNLVVGLNGVFNLEIKIDKAHINYNGKNYYLDDLEDLYQEHPGPFATCPNEE